LGTLAYRPEEPGEDESVEGLKGVPVQVTRQTVRVEKGGLLDARSIGIRKDLEL